MEFNRNHCFVTGVILLLLGIQFRYVESFMLSPETTRFLAEKLDKKKAAAAPAPSFPFLLSVPTPARKSIRPPRWLGWSLISIGAVMVLHSLSMKRPGS